MKKYEELTIKILLFHEKDIVTASIANDNLSDDTFNERGFYTYS